MKKLSKRNRTMVVISIIRKQVHKLALLYSYQFAFYANLMEAIFII